MGKQGPRRPRSRKDNSHKAGESWCRKGCTEGLLVAGHSVPAWQASTEHKDHGLWAIDSVNTGCWSTGFKYSKGSGADIILVQEAKVMRGPGIAEEQDRAKAAGLNAAIGACTHGTDCGGNTDC